jgi:hypothetical protein
LAVLTAIPAAANTSPVPAAGGQSPPALKVSVPQDPPPPIPIPDTPVTPIPAPSTPVPVPDVPGVIEHPQDPAPAPAPVPDPSPQQPKAGATPITAAESAPVRKPAAPQRTATAAKNSLRRIHPAANTGVLPEVQPDARAADRAAAAGPKARDAAPPAARRPSRRPAPAATRSPAPRPPAAVAPSGDVPLVAPAWNRRAVPAHHAGPRGIRALFKGEPAADTILKALLIAALLLTTVFVAIASTVPSRRAQRRGT